MDAVHFEAVITPHRSLGRRGLRVLVCAILLGSLTVMAGLWWAGAWPAMGVNGAEITLALMLLRWNARQERASELLILSDAGLRVRRTDPRGRVQEQILPAAWLRVIVEERQGRAPGVLLAARGVRLEVATLLGEGEKRALAAALMAALEAWRRPSFDNPQLRET